MTGKNTGLDQGRRVVVKIGSALLVDSDHGTIHRRWLESLGADIARLARAQPGTVLIVSSGAIAVGRRRLGHRRHRPDAEVSRRSRPPPRPAMVHLAHAYRAERWRSHGHNGRSNPASRLDDTEEPPALT